MEVKWRKISEAFIEGEGDKEEEGEGEGEKEGEGLTYNTK